MNYEQNGKLDSVTNSDRQDNKNEDLLQLIFRSIYTGIAYLDRELKFVWVNPAYAVAYRRTPEYFIGKSFFEIFPNPTNEAIFRKVIETGGTFSAFGNPASHLNFPGDSETFWDWRLQTIWGDGHQVDGLLLIIENVTSREQAEQALGESQALFEHLFESAPDSNLLIDGQGRILALNRQAEVKFGYARGEMLNQPVELLLPSRFASGHISHRAAFILDPHMRPMGAGLDLYGKRKNGEEFPVDVTLSPLRTNHGLLVLAVVRDITQRKKNQEALRQSEEKLQAVMKTVPVILWAVDRQGVFTLLEGRGLNSIRSKPGELVGRTYQEALSNFPQIQEYIQRALNGEELFVDLQTTNGEIFESSYSPQYDSSGQVVGVIGLATNISARKQTERALKRSEERFRTSVENMLDAFAILTAVRDEQDRIVDFIVEYANEAAVRLTQVGREALVGKRLLETLPGYQSSGLFALYRQVVETSKPLVIEAFDYEDGVEKQQLPRTFDIRATKLDDGLAVSWRDVSEHRQMEMTLQKQEALLRTVLDTLPVGVWVADEQGRIVLDNQAGRSIWETESSGISEQVQVHKGWRRTGGRIGPRDWPIERALHHREITLEEEIDLEMKNGAQKAVLLSAAPLQDKQGSLTGAIMVSQEITERKRMEAELAEVQRRLMDGLESERRRLAQDLHDGPIQDLYGISFQLQGLEDDIKSEEGKSNAQDARASIQEVVQILRDVCGELRPPALVHFGLKKAILSHIEKFQLEHPQVDVSLELFDDRTALPEAARLALFRIYQNTISNIGRHANATLVEIRFGMENDQAILEVRDNGVGFDVPNRWVKLAREGHLGLIGSSERAELVGGRLEIHSSPGQGTLIRAVVPIPTTDAHPVETAKQSL